MSDNQRFDEHIKEQFQDYSPDVHPRIWENIIKERERRKPAGFWLSFLNGRNILVATAIFLATGSAAYLLLRDTPANKDAVTIAENKTPQTTSAPSATSGAEKENNNNIPATTGNSVENTPNNNVTSAVIENNSNTTTDNKTEVDKAVNNNRTGTGTLIKSKAVSKIKIKNSASESGDNIAATAHKKTKKNKRTIAADNDYAISAAELENAGGAAKENDLERLSFTELEKAEATTQPFNLKKRISPNVFLPDCPSIEKDAAGNKTYIEFYGGPDVAFRSLSDTGNSAYLQKRKESTKFSSAYSVGMRYTKVFNNGMSIRTGINYSQINEKFTFVQGNLVQITYIINANGDTTGSYITTGTRYRTTVNKFRTVDVPLVIGYELGNGKFHANINAGVMVNIYSWQKGEVLDTAFRPVSITTGKGNSPYQFKTNIGIGFMFGASVYYKLNEKLHLLAEPYYRYSLAPMSNEKLTFKQKYNTMGLRIGVRLDLH